MSLCIVVHHRSDPRQRWKNTWHDDYILKAIETTNEIGRLCSAAREKKEEIYVHRCRWENNRPTICCSVSVKSVKPINNRICRVEFTNVKALNKKPSYAPRAGQNYYHLA